MSKTSDYNTIQKLKSELQQAYQQLECKDKDLQVYKKEVQQLNVQLRTLIQNIENQLLIATQVQKYLIPTEIPKIPGFAFSTKYIPGPASGGDYFDIFQLQDKHKFAVIMACSSGHTMAALLLSVLIQMSSQIEAKKGISPLQILQSLDKKLSASMPSNETASVFLLIINRRTLKMTYCSAGHIKAWFQPYQPENSNKPINNLLSTLSLLALDSSNQVIQNKQVTKEQNAEMDIFLNAKDRIVLASPGLVSAVQDAISMDDLLLQMQLKSLHDVRNEIIYHAKKTQCKDDMTVLVIDVKDHVLKLTSM